MSRVLSFPGDADARHAIATDLDDTLVVEAAAGTGKTTELVGRILHALAGGRARIDEIAAVTFTEKSAGELKLRLREALEQERAKAGDEATCERLDRALERLEEAHVNTIHGFCAELLRERPVEAAIDPLFVVLTEAEADRMYTRAFRAWLQEVLQDPPEGVRRALRRSSAPSFGGGDSDGPIDRLRGAGRLLAEWRSYPHAWTRAPFDRDAEIRRLAAALHHLADLSAGGAERDSLYIDLDAVRRLSRQIRLEESFGQRNLDAWESRLIDLTRDRGFSRTRKGSGYRFGGHTRSEVLAARDALFADLQQFRKNADADLAALLQQELAGATAAYQALKDRAGALDFADLLVRARDLLRENTAVRRHLQRRFRRIFVDEFQDTDPVQAEILLLLAGDETEGDHGADTGSRDATPSSLLTSCGPPTPGKLFIVGDPKQAIYRFRGTDVGTYWMVSDLLTSVGGRVLQLTKSYRSVPEIQRFVNAAFEEEMVADSHALQAGYVPLAPDRPSHLSQPAVVALPVPAPYSKRSYGAPKISARAIEESLPDAVGAFIAWLVDESGWQVTERPNEGGEVRVPVAPRHVAVLFRRFVSFGEDVTSRYVDAIEARGLPHLLVGGRAFHDREEVETIRAALAAIEWPDDELSVFATLKGSLFAIDDEQLLEFHHRFGPFHPFRVPRELGGNSGAELALSADPTSHLMPIADALRTLQRLHRDRNYRPVADTIGRLLVETRAHVGFMLRPAGEQALANVLHIAELARQYETSGGISFRGFIDELRRAAESAGAAEAPIVEEGSDGVRLMTVHKAKGLEFPVVILADLTCRISRDDASRYVDAARGLCAMKIGGWAPRELYDHEAEEVARDRAEGVRLAYVAATRARDLLVVPAVGDEPWEGGWLAPLNRALYPPLDARRDAARGPGCPAFKSKDSVCDRPDGEAASPRTVAPGLHRLDGCDVVWWDPHVLSLGLRPPFGVRREELIVKDVPRDVVSDGRERYEAWRSARDRARLDGRVPSLVVETARARAASDAPVSGAARVELVDVRAPAGRRRAGGAAFGALVHAVLAQVPLEGARAALNELASIAGRQLGAGDEDVAEAVDAVAQFLDSPLMGRARAADAAGRCRREAPVTLALDGVVVEGVVDLAFEEAGGWVVVDYKTDRELMAGGEERYRRQIALYAEAVAQATGRPAAGMLVRM
ncbi:MAG: UvrD-helicase domain-containing protein [Betaproteobacteria bacterium]